MNTPNFSDIYTLYFEDVYKYLLALCHDEELAEELAQDTFFKAMKSYENFRGDCKITTWLCQIAKHSFFLYEKHRKRNIDLNSVENEIVDTNSIEILLGQREQAFGIHKYEPARHISKTLNEIDSMGQKTITGKMAISKEDYSELTALAKEGITSRAEISELEQSANYYRQKYFDCANALERMKTKYNELKEKCRPFLQALEHFPEVAKLFTEKVKQLFSFKEAQERAEKEAREKERQERIKARRNKRGMER